MPTPIKMPALSPTMEEGTLARWLVKVGDSVAAGDLLAEIETDKATMEFEAVDEGTIASIEIDEGTEGVAVGTVIAMLAADGESVDDAAKAAPGDKPEAKKDEAKADTSESKTSEAPAEPAKAQPRESAEPQKAPAAPKNDGERIFASPLARRIADQKGLDLSDVKGSGPHGRIVKADVEGAEGGRPANEAKPGAVAGSANTSMDGDAPFEEEKVSGVRKVVAKRLTAAKQEVPHYYLSVDIRLDALLAAHGTSADPRPAAHCLWREYQRGRAATLREAALATRG